MKITWAGLLTVLCAIVGISEGRKGFGPGEQEFGYVDVRPGAHMFYWLYYTTAHANYTDRPLVMWLQGGPGESSTSSGNFEEIGPLTVDLKPRDTTWVKHVNLLLVDNPVGSGFSYVENTTLFPKTNQQIGTDLVELMRSFLKQYPSFQTVPFYIFSEGYGGKMAVEFALQLEKEMKSGNIKVNLQGVGLGDPWISPLDYVLSWAYYAFYTGFLDNNGLEMVDDHAQQTVKAFLQGRYADATELADQTGQIVWEQAGKLDKNNILTPVRGGFRRAATPGATDELPKANAKDLQKLMNGPVRLALGTPDEILHGAQGFSVLDALREDYMKNATYVVEELLNKTSLEVVVYTGQLDLMVDVPGTVQWVDKLKWQLSGSWKSTVKQTFVVNGMVEGFVKKAKTLSLYWIHRAGYKVPVDNPAAAFELLRIVTKFDKI